MVRGTPPPKPAVCGPLRGLAVVSLMVLVSMPTASAQMATHLDMAATESGQNPRLPGLPPIPDLLPEGDGGSDEGDSCEDTFCVDQGFDGGGATAWARGHAGPEEDVEDCWAEGDAGAQIGDGDPQGAKKECN